MAYKVEFTSQAEDDMSRVDRTVAERIIHKIEWLSENIEHVRGESLSGGFKDKFKLMVGDWRVIYSVEHPSGIITIYAVGHRREVYKI